MSRRSGAILVIAAVAFAAAEPKTTAQEKDYLVFGFTNFWRYNQTTSYDGTNWTARTFNDSSLPSGRGVLAAESNNPFVTSRTSTTLNLGRMTYYFRTHFTFTNHPQGVTLTFSNILDDGAVFYLNGVEVRRFNMPAAPASITYDTASTIAYEATTFDVFTLAGPVVDTNLVAGDNVLAVEVHQESSGSDVVFGLALSAWVPDPRPPPSLQMPQEPPSYGFRFVDAFGSMFIADPLAITTPPGETNRLFVVEQEGRIVVMTNLAAPNLTVFLDITGRVVGDGERGLLGLAFHPGYATNRLFYTFYTVNTTSAQGRNALHERLSQWRASASNPNAADTTSELILFEQFDEAINHNAGDLHFGRDGYLYVSLGDEGGGIDFYQNSQRIDRDFFSGLLRIDVDNRPTSLMPNPHPANTNNPGRTIRYRIPPDNPWVDATNFNGLLVDPARVRTEFYAVGMRNPWRFSFDPLTDDLYLADVGQEGYEEVNLIRAGGNYGWNYREGLHPGPRTNPPPDVVFDDPIVEYSHGPGTNQGNSVIGGVVYRGTNFGSLRGAYVFADYVSGNVWALRANGTNVVPFWRLTVDTAISAFGVDPRNGDILAADRDNATIRRLVAEQGTVIGSRLPPTLFHTGAFTNLSQVISETDPLTPNSGVTPYNLNVPFWSDNARKSRWFFRADTNQTFGFSSTGNWSFPTGTVWVKHFDLQLTNGEPSSAKRLETRFIVKNSGGVYGVTYRWGNCLTNASLVPEEGMDDHLVIYDGGLAHTQTWHYPGRAECLACHTPSGGFALGFNTAQLNCGMISEEGPINQITALQRAGYLDGPLTNTNLLPVLVHATNNAWSREWRVRSYLAANCAQCHQPGGAGGGTWDARYSNPLSAAGLIGGLLDNDAGDTNNRVVVPGDLARSMLLTRISMRGPKQMPPLASTELDQQAIDLLSEWIRNDLPSWQSFADWQIALFGGTNAPGAGPDEDADLDSASNQLEWLTLTDPFSSADFHAITATRSDMGLVIHVPAIAGRGFEVQHSPTLDPPNWQPLDVSGNAPFFSATDRILKIHEPATDSTHYYRVRVFEP